MSGYKSQRPWPDPRSEPPETRGGTVWPPVYECAYKRFLLRDDNYYLLHFIPVDLFEMWDMAFKCQISIICQMVDIANGALILRFLRSFFYLFFLYIYLSVVTHSLGFWWNTSFVPHSKHWLALTVVPAEILGEKILELSRKKKKKAKSKTQNPKAAEVRQVPRRLLHICTLQLQHGALITRRCSLARSYRFSSHLPPVRPRSVQLAPPRWCRESEGVLSHASSVANGTTDGRAPSKNL